MQWRRTEHRTPIRCLKVDFYFSHKLMPAFHHLPLYHLHFLFWAPCLFFSVIFSTGTARDMHHCYLGLVLLRIFETWKVYVQAWAHVMETKGCHIDLENLHIIITEICKIPKNFNFTNNDRIYWKFKGEKSPWLGVVLFPRQLVTGEEEMASKCTRGPSD